MSKQVQLRGGTTIEHKKFIGAPREVTVDTDLKTLRVHDGETPGGNELATLTDVVRLEKRVNNKFDQFEIDLAESHNHDNLYIKLTNGRAHNLQIDNIRFVGRDMYINEKRSLVGFGEGEGDQLYINYANDFKNGVTVNGEVKIPDNCIIKGKRPFLDRVLNGYYGICTPDADDVDWIRSTKNGFIPYQAGGYSNIGTSSWRFSQGWFDNVNTKSITVAKNGNTSSILFPAQRNDPGFIQHYENNDSSRMYFSVSDNDNAINDEFIFGSTPNDVFSGCVSIKTTGDMWLKGRLTQDSSVIHVGGRYVYFDGRRPSDAPDGSISFG